MEKPAIALVVNNQTELESLVLKWAKEDSELRQLLIQEFFNGLE